ncbi:MULTISPECIES: serine/threonine protein kinase [unclassified Psychrobacter]|uniref:serine/threonine protein kinase n=1 Tax=unclassified Psychrobacter TaxID=196806 RepID=UPI0025D711C4|nr:MULTISPECIES: serine/threonine-protein kinase [unclassified Psychrobacter]
MKNSASNCSVIQAKTKQGFAKQTLQTDAQQILPALTTVFSNLQYSNISHRRLSQQGVSSGIVYQGLTRAQHPNFGQVMIKWQLSTDNHRNMADLAYEAEALKSISQVSNNQVSFFSIAPPLLASHHSQLKVLNNNQKLTILVMPDYASGSLAQYLKQTLSDSQKHRFIVQTAHLVANLHNVGWLHNDIKPSNILLDNASLRLDLLLTDFALAQRFEALNVENPAGTPAYLAPERWQGQGATMQSDVYAFGIMMYEVITGERPFSIDSLSREPLKEWATQHCQKPIPKLPVEYSRYQGVINKALAKRVKRRYRTMEKILLDLENIGK